MIKNVEINYPWFNLILTREFNPWLNIIEEENGYGKSTILNTIMSAYTFKFSWLKTLPEWTATINTDKDKFVLTKKNWIGTTHQDNDLYKYTMPWKFFDWLTTPMQRKIIVDLLWLDYNAFMKDLCDKAKEQFTYLDWSEDLDSNLKAKMKEFETNEVLILQDINRLKSELINFEEKSFDDVNLFNEQKEKVIQAIKEYNAWIIQRQTDYNKLINIISWINNRIENLSNQILSNTNNVLDLSKQLDNLRVEYSTTNDNATCDKCWSKIDWEQKQSVLDWLHKVANKIKDDININNEIIKWCKDAKDKLILELNEKNKLINSFDNSFIVMWYDNLISASKQFNVEFNPISELRLNEYESYKESLQQRLIVERELKFKEDKLKSIDTLKLQSNIDKLKEFKTMFTKKLEDETKNIWLDIQLFEVLKNGNIRETFTINYNWIDYYDLSTWNKTIVNIKLAKLFIDKLWLDFILIDEAANIGKANIWLIKELSQSYQVILARPTTWKASDFK